ncbi:MULTISPECIES: chemotaxis protein CheW [unclassified Dyella]|uniref:chemotaxis protein CheW n=1 Tax=unclassified Dyella TaxID=2634549 RepID=UPI000CBDF93F|nr:MULTISPECIES: chemotaxis protein CheW [unclassified Dyella]MDR3446171.1 chemotaxis protein CheW [Dyella sp.]PMQ04420.1 Chemotaxis protein CheW [Dyella sp. AD56]
MESSIASLVRQDAAEMFGSFHLGDTELVLPVAAVQEVVNYPSVVTQVPLAPSYLLGLFNLRGRLIPIVHLGEVLELPERGPREGAKIAIVEFRQGRVGLLFDATGEILRVPAEQKVMFSGIDGAPSMIGGALKLDGGQRILQILSVDALHRLPDMPMPRGDAQASDPARLRAAQGQRRQGVSFRVNDTRLALPMGAIHEIIRVPELLSSVLASELCLGMLNLRGNTVPVVDFARFLGLPSTASPTAVAGDFEDARRIVVLRQKDMDFGLLVDDVESIVSYRDEELLAIPSFHAEQPPLFTGCISREAAPDILLIDELALLSDATVADITQGHRELYSVESTAERGQGKRRSGVRETYVTFRLEQLMGMRIDQLREVIDFPSDMMQPPGAPDYVRGILNLRRKLVTIIDMRSLYGMKSYADVRAAKVLVVENDEEKFGLVVDAIENIVTIDVADKLGVPGVLRNQIDPALRNDMRDVVELPDQRTLLLLDASPLKERLSGRTMH